MQKSDYKPKNLTRGSVVDYEGHKITTTTQSKTVAELQALMKCFGARMFLEANNLVTTAQTTHLPEQKETRCPGSRGSGHKAQDAGDLETLDHGQSEVLTLEEVSCTL